VEGGVLVENGKLVKESIISRSNGFVEKYEVIAEGREGSEYLVTLRVEVKNGSLVNALDGIGVLLGRKQYPRVFIEKEKDTEANSLLKTEVTAILKGKGFFITSAGQHSDIVLVVNGEIRDGEFTYRNHPINFSEIIVNMTAHKASSKDVLSSVSTSGKRPGVNQLEVKLDLIQSSAREATDKIVGNLVANWQQSMEGETKIVCFFKGLNGGYDDFLNIREFLMANGPRVNKIILRDFFGDTGVMEIFAGVSPLDFFQEVTNMEYSGRKFFLEELQQESAVINMGGR
jgi:hypothetical protein